jgi:hypothetical protein
MSGRDLFGPQLHIGAKLAAMSVHESNPAQWAHERIVKSIIQFEEALDAEHEIGARLVSFGEETFHIDDVGYWGPDIVKFYGHNAEKEPVELIQHISQISILLVAMKKVQEPARRIGFELQKGLDKEKSDKPEE